MNHRFQFKIKSAIVLCGMFGMLVAQADAMTRADFQAGKTRISAEYKTNKAACSTQSGNARDICVEEAKGKEKVARAELEFGYTAKPADQTKLLVAKAESAYAIAKERCDDQSGNAKDVCVKEAKAAEVKALADSKMGEQIRDARTEATDDKRDADYKVAVEKCDASSGDVKAACVAAAKSRFGKM
ncbi:hypothetical protein [uncultured Sphaerotilus sp.]|uniref:hypothetical protein n=1 Tax=uncultured Sphaerotilus sp. TaxID=474984 RepID=UPI0030CA1E6D